MGPVPALGPRFGRTHHPLILASLEAGGLWCGSWLPGSTCERPCGAGRGSLAAGPEWGQARFDRSVKRRSVGPGGRRLANRYGVDMEESAARVDAGSPASLVSLRVTD